MGGNWVFKHLHHQFSIQFEEINNPRNQCHMNTCRPGFFNESCDKKDFWAVWKPFFRENSNLFQKVFSVMKVCLCVRKWLFQVFNSCRISAERKTFNLFPKNLWWRHFPALVGGLLHQHCKRMKHAFFFLKFSLFLIIFWKKVFLCGRLPIDSGQIFSRSFYWSLLPIGRKWWWILRDDGGKYKNMFFIAFK